MPGSPSRIQQAIERCRERYTELWSKVVSRRVPPVAQATAAEDLNESKSTVSRVLNGKRMPRSHELLVKLSRVYGARPEETRTLLAWASALTAFDAGEYDVAEQFLEMFRPLYAEGALASRMARPSAVVFNILLDLGVPRKVADEIAGDEHIANCKSVQEAVGYVMTFLFDLGVKVAPSEFSQIPNLVKTHTQIAVVDFDSPSIDGASAVKEVHQAELRGDCETAVWRPIPHLAMTRVFVRAGRRVADTKHDGFEFLFLERGKGIFQLRGAGKVELSQGGRKFIAYRPSGAHSFTADKSTDALFYVISYCRPSEQDPTDDILKAASESEPSSAFGLRRKRRRTKTEQR